MERVHAAELYWQAFGQKLDRIMGPSQRAVAFLSRGLRADHCISACDETGRVIGLAGFKSARGSFSTGTSDDLRQIYGVWGASWRQWIFRMFSSEIDNEHFLIDGIAVDEGARGQGVGTALLRALCDEAYKRGYDAVRLEVASDNCRARALYEREGFVALRVDQLGVLRFVFGFDAAVIMVRDLRQDQRQDAHGSVKHACATTD